MRKDREVDLLGNHLKGKKIGLFATGCIATYKEPSLIRHFRHYGADVQVYMTEAAQKYVTKDAVEWASLHPPICGLTPDAEHLEEHDAFVVAPATLNTIGKMANGISDNAVTSTLAAALGDLDRAPVLVAPAMHGRLEKNPFYKRNLDSLKEKGVKVIDPVYKWDKANFPSPHEIVAPTIREVSKSPLKKKSILVTAGPVPVWIDDVRLITNKFRGTLGLKIAEEAYMRGADVDLIMGPGGLQVPRYINNKGIRSFDQYYEEVMESLGSKGYDFAIFSAAVADYAPKKKHEGKIASRGAIKSIPLKETVKVIESVRKVFPMLDMVTFKYEKGVSQEELERIASNRVSKGYDMVVANRGEEMTHTEHHSIIVDKNGVISRPRTKDENAFMLLDALERRL